MRTKQGDSRRDDLAVYPFQRQRYTIVRKKQPIVRPAKAEAVNVAVDVRQVVLNCIQSVLGLGERDVVDERAPFLDLGFDSLLAVELSRKLSIAFQRTFSEALVFDHPTVTKLISFISLVSRDVLVERSTDDVVSKISLIGLSIRCSNASTLSEFSTLLIQGADPVLPFGESFFANVIAKEEIPSTLDAFKISPRESALINDCQRLLLCCALEAVSGVSSVLQNDTSVYVGIDGSSGGDLKQTDDALFSVTGALASVAAGRIAYLFDFAGEGFEKNIHFVFCNLLFFQRWLWTLLARALLLHVLFRFATFLNAVMLLALLLVA